MNVSRECQSTVRQKPSASPRKNRLPFASTLLEVGIRSQERRLHMRLEYLRDVAEHAPSLVMKLGLLGPLGDHRRRLPRDVFHVARLQAVLAEDCGECAQMTANLAKEDGVSPAILKAVATGNLVSLTPALGEVCQFVDATLMQLPSQGDLRELMRDRYGEDGLAELAAAIALASFFPRFKRALGYAHSCSLQPVDV